MLSFWKQFFRKVSNASNITAMPTEFPSYAKKAVQLLAASHGQLEDTQVVDLFIANSIPHEEAIELLLFLPTAFCRHMMPQINWPLYYIEQDITGTLTEVYYIENSRYTAIKITLMHYLAGDFTQQDYLKIAGRNASFKALNKLMLNGGLLENASISPEVIIR